MYLKEHQVVHHFMELESNSTGKWWQRTSRTKIKHTSSLNSLEGAITANQDLL